MYCSQCGASNEPSVHFCKNCGAALTVTDATENSDILYTPPPQTINAFSTLLFWGVVILMLGFFLPWVSIAGFITLNGWNIGTGLMQTGSYGKTGANTTLYSIMLYSMPIASIIVLVGLFSNANKVFLRIFKMVPIVVVLAFTGIALSNLKGRFEGEVFRYLSFGFYLTIIGAILLAFAPVKK